MQEVISLIDSANDAPLSKSTDEVSLQKSVFVQSHFDQVIFFVARASFVASCGIMVADIIITTIRKMEDGGIPDERIEKARHLDKEFDVQNDLKYRKEWDPNVMSLDLLKEEGEHELIRWVQKYPYPLYPREYVYTRRTWVSDDSRMIVVDSEVVPPHLIAGSDKNVRVSTYTSRMAVRSHREFDERGLDFILTYFDNPEANIPRSVYNWIINRGGPYFLNQVHEAACEMEETGRRLTWTSERVQRNRQRLKKLSDAKSAILLLPESATDEENKVNEEELEDAVPMLTKAQKFSFVSVDNLPAEAYVTV
ncbi:START domain protein [Ancylostoma ceylanicum]|uniref:Phosphatidylcholine transfer protein n=1 Tax=Ancylostoma ceylanicum TaxID=53326 RepID=A0A0D6LGN3_9BILA|nr:START domain protein [Ancylostoma ceylanicum]